jgi:hypothetical protein
LSRCPLRWIGWRAFPEKSVEPTSTIAVISCQGQEYAITSLIDPDRVYPLDNYEEYAFEYDW